MTISFGSNHLYIVPNGQAAYSKLIREDGLNSRKVNKIDNNKVLVLDGQDYLDYEKAVKNIANTYNIPAHSQILNGYADRAVKIDLRKAID